jgi:hypothetical protein
MILNAFKTTAVISSKVSTSTILFFEKFLSLHEYQMRAENCPQRDLCCHSYISETAHWIGELTVAISALIMSIIYVIHNGGFALNVDLARSIFFYLSFTVEKL